MELMNLDGILLDEFLLKRPIQKCVDGLERFIIAGRGGVGDCGKKCQHIAFEQGIPMKEDNHAQEIYAIWIDHVNRIISFRKEDGFEPQAFSSQDERMQYALEKSTNGYRVQ